MCVPIYRNKQRPNNNRILYGIRVGVYLSSITRVYIFIVSIQSRLIPNDLAALLRILATSRRQSPNMYLDLDFIFFTLIQMYYT